MAEVFLRRLTRWQAEAQREAVADLYVEAYRGPSGEEFRERGAFLQRFAEHIQRPGFDMVIASDPALVGCAYGFPAERDGRLWQGFNGQVPRELEELTASGRVFVVAELMVLPTHRRGHVATRLQETLLLRSSAAMVVTLVDTANGAARSAVRAWGWQPTGRLLRSDDGEPEREAWSRGLAH
ncbi:MULTISPECIES: GNAT family N-acetyltransferase [Streptomyces]|uniref:GNAT family N-acetyltransferase n=1 Tax=Streptomyces TaxID=1883 RepID=UPI0006B288B9|nr:MULTISPECIES: GNAT family N-acetyltransferase [Streptomyces]